jgi:hypothetical protein
VSDLLDFGPYLIGRSEAVYPGNGHTIENPMSLVAPEKFTKPDPNVSNSEWFTDAERSGSDVA